MGGDGLAEDAVGDLKGFAGPKLFHLEGFASGFGKADAVQSQVGIPAAGGLIRQVEETDGQIAILTEMGLDSVQGFYFSKPRPNYEFRKFLKENPFDKEGYL